MDLFILWGVLKWATILGGIWVLYCVVLLPAGGALIDKWREK